MGERELRVSSWLLVAAVALGVGTWTGVLAQIGPAPLVSPRELAACQVDYGEAGAVRLSWVNPESFELIEVLVDGEQVPLAVDGAATTAQVEADPGVHTFGVRGVVGMRRSAVAKIATL